jgi:hypothetical protein
VHGIGIGSLSNDLLRRRRDRDGGNRFVQDIPERRDTQGGWTPADHHAEISAGEPFRVERFVRSRLRVALAEVAVELVQRRRAKAMVDGTAHSDTGLADAIGAGQTGIERSRFLRERGGPGRGSPSITVRSEHDRQAVADANGVLQERRAKTLPPSRFGHGKRAPL